MVLSAVADVASTADIAEVASSVDLAEVVSSADLVGDTVKLGYIEVQGT